MGGFIFISASFFGHSSLRQDRKIVMTSSTSVHFTVPDKRKLEWNFRLILREAICFYCLQSLFYLFGFFFTFSLTTHLQKFFNIFTKSMFSDDQHNTGGHLSQVNIKQHLFEKNDYSKNYKVLITKKDQRKQKNWTQTLIFWVWANITGGFDHLELFEQVSKRMHFLLSIYPSASIEYLGCFRLKFIQHAC